jgi:hypothetical protein
MLFAQTAPSAFTVASFKPNKSSDDRFMLPLRAEPSRSADSNGPSIFTALEEQRGLKLKSAKGPVDTLVIDHVERASEN